MNNNDVWNICPVCGSRSIIAESPEEYFGELHQFCICQDCGSTFENIYTYSTQSIVNYCDEEQPSFSERG